MPLLLLRLALSTVLVFGNNDWGRLYRPGLHDGVTVDYLTVAVNLSPAHNFVGFFRQLLTADGTLTY